MERLVIVGGGLAAAKAVERLREEGYEGSVTVVGAEGSPPYERPPLSKDLLLGKDTDPTVLDADWWSEHDVQLMTGTRVTALDREARRVELESGDRLEYDLLVLATGAEPRVPDLPGADRALYLRTLEDKDRILATLESGSRLVIVGAGWIGLEVAAAARSHDVRVTVLERDDLPLQRVLGDELATHLAALHRSHGVDLRTGVTVEEIVLGDDGPVGVRASGETIEADHVLVAIGAVPATALAEESGLEVDDGIVVDERFQTADEHVLAIGDVAGAWNVTLEDRLRVEHWDNAIRQGRAVADVLLGRDTVHDWYPYFYTDQFEFSMEYVGRPGPKDTVEIRGDLEANAFIAYWIDEESRLTAGMNVGIWDVNDTLREMVGTRVDRSELTDLS
ncbi:FAD-dependent oxidoreductase [Aeromicrobium tamlense]|uniref:3-phenylpropionate/trans-cinnamate dioxygenase ferredoxin reductase subunit n=1 Tax=Aeromicrobium tamlense TaxID=375541 RepID=A0A8I0FZR1_9ACTN|nr:MULTISPECIES: FAD-dependent oxidoreductase [Aeromicrobium]MBD1270289.1 FAD-dependent oxidoreductase [Aeromicrobium tamlense]MBD1271579.1 FAD-dependent oxidoreductase [Aeromicrobium tamlense]NYI37675.1 3-phenylpropionate/trans-cinnamate dioxygenase ferredoxin reductase subunit [Aeromicrobium tamlense]